MFLFLALHLYGFTKNAIVYDTKIKNWVIVDDVTKQDYTILGIFIPTKSASQIPRGTTPWKLLDPNCNQTRILKLSSVTAYYLHIF